MACILRECKKSSGRFPGLCEVQASTLYLLQLPRTSCDHPLSPAPSTSGSRYKVLQPGTLLPCTYFATVKLAYTDPAVLLELTLMIFHCNLVNCICIYGVLASKISL